jgi:glycosyltransferase involved in cell wall biosynthesis
MMQTSKRYKICLILEGTYPYITGGVSAWVHQLILGTPEFDFLLLTLSSKANQLINYTLPQNVIGHQDVVISQKQKIKKKLKNMITVFRELTQIHQQMHSNTAPEIEKLVNYLPEEYYLYADALNSKSGWDSLAIQNQLKNPIYPFADYFWAWKSSHDIIFTILGLPLPEADIYHAVSTGYAGLLATVAKMRKQKPYILTEHGLYHKEREIEIRRCTFVKGYQREMYIKIFYSLSRISYHYADIIISLFEYNRQQQINLGANELKTMVIPNGIDIPFFSTKPREKKDGFHIGLVGRVVPIKDIKTFISMAKVVTTTIPDAKFYCIGPTDEDPDYFEECQILVNNLQLSSQFIFTGRADVREYYAFLDVVALTSIREAQPLVILEAYCAGIPVVATRVGNIPELLNYDEHFLAPPKDAEKLAEGIFYIYHNRERIISLNTKNKEKVNRFYDREMLHSQYRQLYKQTIENPNFLQEKHS